MKSGDAELPYVKHYATTKTARKFDEVVEHLTLMHPIGTRALPDTAGTGHSETLLQPLAKQEETTSITKPNKEASMRFAVPTNDKKLCGHFGHCEAFALIDTDGDGKFGCETYVTPPPHEPGLLPPWLAQQGVNCVIAGGMGGKAPAALRRARREGGYRRAGGKSARGGGELPEGDPCDRDKYV